MTEKPTPGLSNVRGVALYVGALLGPSLLLLPGLAADIAGPASILAWLGMLAVSGLLSWIFAAFGVRHPGGNGVAGYAAAGLGTRAGAAVGWCFLAGVVFGAPVVCLIGGGYVAELVGGGRTTSVLAAAVLLAAVVTVTLTGARSGTAIQLVLVAVLVVLVVVAVAGALPTAEPSHWTPFLPHGWRAVGSASAALMLSLVGWEAIAPLTARLAEPRRQLPRIIGVAFAVTAAIYLALAVTTVGVLGARAGSDVPLADLLQVAVGPVGVIMAAVVAVALTLAATNAYLTGAAVLAAELRASHPRSADTRWLQLGIVAVGLVLLGGVAAGVVDTAQLVAMPTALFLAVYAGCTAAAVRVLRGPVRVAAGVALFAVLGVLAFTGWAVLLVVAVVVVSYAARRSGGVRRDRVGRARATSQCARTGHSRL